MRLFDPPRPAQVRRREGVVERGYYQAATRLGRVYLLFQEGDAWFVQGAFD